MAFGEGARIMKRGVAIIGWLALLASAGAESGGWLMISPAIAMALASNGRYRRNVAYGVSRKAKVSA